MTKTRIQKVLSAAGIGSRRAIEQMILDGRITVNGELVMSLPCFVEPRDEILVDGQIVRKRPQEKVYVLLNKPRGVITTQRDHPGYNRPRATDLIAPLAERVYCAGRMDEDATGLIILTNDGELTNRLTHPRYGLAKTYLASVVGRVGPGELSGLQRGQLLGGRRVSRTGAKVLRRGPTESLLEIRLVEDHHQQVRQTLLRMGHELRRLHRSAIGPITDRGLKIGHSRLLSPAEVASLRRATGATESRPAPSPRGRRPPRLC